MYGQLQASVRHAPVSVSRLGRRHHAASLMVRSAVPVRDIGSAA